MRGTYPGNMFDMTPYVQLSDTSDNFTTDDIYRYRRSISITTTGALPRPLVWGLGAVAHLQGTGLKGVGCGRPHRWLRLGMTTTYVVK